jgi:hypothetical protein
VDKIKGDDNTCEKESRADGLYTSSTKSETSVGSNFKVLSNNIILGRKSC